MNFEFFASLTPAEAKSFLSKFRETEGGYLDDLLQEATKVSVRTDFTIASAAEVLKWLAGQVEVIGRMPDMSLPIWIRNTESYASNLFELTDSSKALVLRGAFYLGECFVRTFPQLTWAVGDAETAQQNMPVISGFAKNLEMAPILVVENLFRRILSGMSSTEAIDIAIDRWVVDVS